MLLHTQTSHFAFRHLACTVRAPQHLSGPIRGCEFVLYGEEPCTPAATLSGCLAAGHAGARGRQPEAATGQGCRGRSQEWLGCDSNSPVPSEHGGSQQQWAVTYWLIFPWEQ